MRADLRRAARAWRGEVPAGPSVGAMCPMYKAPSALSPHFSTPFPTTFLVYPTLHFPALCIAKLHLRNMIRIDGTEFEPLPGVKYPHNYVKAASQVAAGQLDEHSVYRALILADPFFFLHFVLKMPNANHPFVVGVCHEVMSGPDDEMLDLWPREHFKTTILSIVRPVQSALKNPDERIAWFCYIRGLSKAILRSVKQLFETSDLLKTCFPDVLWENPEREAPKWSEEDGLILKRKNVYKESTFEAWGLIEGMPTGRHFTCRIYDDCETDDLVNTPELIRKTHEAFDLSQFLGMDGGKHTVCGTHYHHEGLMNKLRQAKREDGSPAYTVRLKKATDDGRFDGAPVFISPARNEVLKRNRTKYASQMLLDPSAEGIRPLEPSWVKTVPWADIPRNLYKFMMVDGADMRRDGRQGDCWSMMLCGVNPVMDDIGTSDVYILDLIAATMRLTDALKHVVRMYMRGGRILVLGVEKVSISTTEVHIVNALRAKGKYLSEERGTLKILRPGGRKKEDRINTALEWPMSNGKWKISDSIESDYAQRLRDEMEKFPAWHNDVLDTAAYLYDIIKEYRFPRQTPKDGARERDENELDAYDQEIRRRANLIGRGWMAA